MTYGKTDDPAQPACTRESAAEQALPPGSSVLVTGASGFLGRHILHKLRAQEATVHAVARTSHRDGDGVRWHRADLLDPADCIRLVEEIRPSHLIHSAWMAVPGIFWTSPQNNDWLSAGQALLDAFGRNGGRRFVGVGTCAEYDWSAAEFIEDTTPTHPSTLYGKTKLAMCRAVGDAAGRHGFSWGWGRVFLPYGPGEAAERLIPAVFAAVSRGETVNLSEGVQERDFIFAPDAADLIVRILLAAESGIFNVGTGIATTVRAAAERAAALAGGPDLLQFGVLASRPDEPGRLVASMAKVSQKLAWNPQDSLESGLGKTWRAFASGHLADESA